MILLSTTIVPVLIAVFTVTLTAWFYQKRDKLKSEAEQNKDTAESVMSIEEGEDVQKWYDLRALVEASALSPELIDYLITEHYDLMTQAEWADIRGVDSSAVRNHVSGAKTKLSD